MNEQDLQTSFLEQLGDDRQQIMVAWNDLREKDDWKEADRLALMQAAHRLAGAALTVGFGRIGSAARMLENSLKKPYGSDRGQITQLVEALLREMDEPVTDGKNQGTPLSAHSINNLPSLQDARASSSIYLADDDPMLTESLATQLRYFGYNIHTFSKLSDLRKALEEEIPAAILMDIMFPEGELAGIETIRSLQEEYGGRLPVFFLSVRDDVATRLQAIRIGGKHYFVKPVEISALVDALDRMVGHEKPEQYRVLVVDDSEVQAKVNALHLKKAGINSRILTNPIEILHALDEFLPDLLLLDLYMPECTGLELAQVIRQIKAYVSLPIVYLSAETDREKQLTAVGLGGDDFLTKPIKPDHLITAVTSRIARYRQLRALMLRDSLTGLYNHTSIRERLGQEVARTQRGNTPMALAMLDIDYFKEVNDTHGHATGDRVLKALTHILTRRLRQNDIIGRYGGDEFVVILPNIDAQTAVRVMNELREGFSQVRHAASGVEFTLSVSCGVSVFPDHKTPAALSEAADRALYSAKRQGRNRVVLAE